MDEPSQFLEDLRLVQAVRRDEREAVERFEVRLRCIGRILAAQNARLGRPFGPEDLADLSQEVFLVVWRKLDDFAPHTTLEGWIYRIAFLQMMNHLRKSRRRRIQVEEAIAERASQALLPERALDLERVHVGLSILEPDERAVVELKHFEDEAFPGIAARLGVPLGTVKTRYYRGLVKLKEFLRNHDGQEERGGAPSGARALDRGTAHERSHT